VEGDGTGEATLTLRCVLRPDQSRRPNIFQRFTLDHFMSRRRDDFSSFGEAKKGAMEAQRRYAVPYAGDATAAHGGRQPNDPSFKFRLSFANAQRRISVFKYTSSAQTIEGDTRAMPCQLPLTEGIFRRSRIRCRRAAPPCASIRATLLNTRTELRKRRNTFLAAGVVRSERTTSF